MSEAAFFAIRNPCPPGACQCDRDRLLNDQHSDKRILQLTREEEKKLIARIEAISTYDELKRIVERMRTLLGIELQITPGAHEVRTVRGFQIQLADSPGLCRKTRQSIPAAVRRCLESHPDVGYAILDAHGLFGEN
jgi:hypothetical protein